MQNFTFSDHSRRRQRGQNSGGQPGCTPERLRELRFTGRESGLWAQSLFLEGLGADLGGGQSFKLSQVTPGHGEIGEPLSWGVVISRFIVNIRE